MLALASLCLSAFVSADESVKKELEAVYAKIDATIKAKDIKSLESFLTKDFEMIEDGKKLNRAETLAQWEKQFEMLSEVTTFKTTIDKIQHVEGNEVVDITQTVKGTFKGADGKTHTLEAVGKSRDFWTKSEDGKWLCNTIEDKGGEVKIDGKPVK